MGIITGRRYYCVRCHDRPVDDDIWQAGGPDSRLCEVCRDKPKIGYRQPNPRSFYVGDGATYRGLKARWRAYQSGFKRTRYLTFDDERNIVSTNLSRSELDELQCFPKPEE